ncbi:MAG: nucleotidyltransferase family protein [Aulosira sp. DedQUE10]|nr:nucleotidyltransferase family protein [Aulosira sp. DedQUE10]
MNDRIPLVRGYKLTQTEKQLLQATLLQGQAALSAWKQWRSSVDIEVLDSDSYALLPQLYQNLLAHDVKDVHMARLKGIYRRNWYADQLKLKYLKGILSDLNDVGIPAIVLGDAAFCSDRGNESNQVENYRPISSFHLLVHGDRLEKTIQRLQEVNWHTHDVLTKQFIQLQDDQKQRLYLQGHLFWAIPQDYTDEQVWQNATADWSDVAGWRLSPTDQFLDRCARMFFRQRSRQIYGIADAFLLVRKSGNDLDWMRLITQAQRYQMILPVRNMLTLLHQVLQLSVPSWVLSALLQMPIAQTEWLNYQVLAEDQRSRVYSILAQGIRPLNYLETRLLRLKHHAFPGKQILKNLLIAKKSAFE